MAGLEIGRQHHRVLTYARGSEGSREHLLSERLDISASRREKQQWSRLCRRHFW
jgi:hypothetical protein